MPTQDATPVHLSEEALVAKLQAILVRGGASVHVAGIIARNCVACERDGSKSHGIFRMRGYVGSITSGWVDARAEPVVEDCGPAMVRVDAGNGFAQVALDAARPAVIDKARAAGVAVLAIRNSHHLSALWPDVEPFAREGLIAISVVNSMAVVVPHGGYKPVLGTNPFAYATPTGGSDPMVVDFATSAMPNGDVQMAAREGRLLPEGVAVDGAGQPTRDANVVLSEGALVPFGGAKGSALSVLIEVLCAGLTGGLFSHEVDWSAYPGAQTPHTGQTVIVIDPDRGHPGSFAGRIQHLLGELEEAGLAHMPGQRRYAARAKAATGGVAVTLAELAMLDELG